jgi:ubiquinone/menaquinone biosynthesis C-methylase UbiE
MKHEAVADFYNDIKTKFGDDYESKRWFRSPVTESHFRMATKAISEVLSLIHFKKCLELGPGAGTWTKLLLSFEGDARYTLLDISETMLSIAKKNLEAEGEKIEFITSDFLLKDFTDSYDFFFSSRALEYILDKHTAVTKMYNLLDKGGEGVIITKNPRYWADKLFGREIPELHRNQVTPKALIKILRDVGFTVQILRPATMTVPFFKSARLNDIAFRLLRHSWIPFVHRIFTESYIVHFKKHGD